MECNDFVVKPCKICGRSFNLVSLDRHENICETSKKFTKRTVFKSFMQRSREIDLVPVEKEEEKEKNPIRPKEATCKRKNILLNNGQSTLKAILPDYQQCPSCHRHFSQKAAERHISWCQEQRIRLPKTPPNAAALERLQARIKYQAPKFRKKSLPEGNIRLVKSAESARESFRLRTHSSPSLNSHGNLNTQSYENGKKPPDTKMRSFFKSKSDSEKNLSNVCKQDSEVKKVVKFKEQFPLYDKERSRSKNLDMLRALRLHFSQLSTSEEHFNQYILRPHADDNHKSSSNSFALPVMQLQQNSNGVNHNPNDDDDNNNYDLDGKSYFAKIENTEKRLPKFCYNCGTRYPVVNAKYCCECGVRRLVLGTSDHMNSIFELS